MSPKFFSVLNKLIYILLAIIAIIAIVMQSGLWFLILQAVYVMPSSSARFTQLPRAVDKVPFYIALKKLRDHLCGLLPHLDESEVTFPDLELKVEPKKERLDAEVKIEADTTSEGGKTAPKRRKRKTEKAGEVEEHNSPDKQPMVASVNLPSGLSKVKTEPGILMDLPSGLLKVKTEPGISTSDVPLLWNGMSSIPPRISGAYLGNPDAYLGKPSSCLEIPSAHSGSSRYAGSGNPYLVPLPPADSFAVKEEIAQDLSQYGVMPLSSSSSYPYSPLASSFQGTVPSVYNSFPPITLPLVTVGSAWPPDGAMSSVYGNPLASLAASFSYAPHSNALTRMQPLHGLKDHVPGSLKDSSSREEDGNQRF